MFEILGTVLSSILSGGATGLIGILIQRFFDLKSKDQDLKLIALNNKQALDLADKEIEKSAAEWAARAKIADREVSGRIEEAVQDTVAREAEAAALVQQASYAADRSTFLTGSVLRSKSRVVLWSMALVDAARGLVRPVLTAYLTIVTYLMYRDMQNLLAQYGEKLPVSTVQDLLLQVISTILYLATVSVVWWFGTRPPSRTQK